MLHLLLLLLLQYQILVCAGLLKNPVLHLSALPQRLPAGDCSQEHTASCAPPLLHQVLAGGCELSQQGWPCRGSAQILQQLMLCMQQCVRLRRRTLQPALALQPLAQRLICCPLQDLAQVWPPPPQSLRLLLQLRMNLVGCCPAPAACNCHACVAHA